MAAGLFGHVDSEAISFVQFGSAGVPHFAQGSTADEGYLTHGYESCMPRASQRHHVTIGSELRQRWCKTSSIVAP